jgi:hypothetical protein
MPDESKVSIFVARCLLNLTLIDNNTHDGIRVRFLNRYDSLLNPGAHHPAIISTLSQHLGILVIYMAQII